MALVVASATDPGRRRPQNEDCLAVWTPPGADERARRGTLLVVADGMGGAAAGEVASRLAVETVLECYRASAAASPVAALREALEEANRSVHRESVLHAEYRGMGTTCTAAVVRGREVTIAHVGDSRAYLTHGAVTRPLTRDHTLVAHLVAEGTITAEQARVDARRNVVTRSIGVSEIVEVDAEEWGPVLETGDALLLCTDGLHGLVEEAELAEATAATPDEACRALVALANQRGGPDNITVIVARATTDVAPTPAPRATPLAVAAPPAVPAPLARRAWPLGTVLALALLGVVLALVVFAALRAVR